MNKIETTEARRVRAAAARVAQQFLFGKLLQGSTRVRRQYTGAQLREIRKKNGVGRPPAVTLARMKKKALADGC